MPGSLASGVLLARDFPTWSLCFDLANSPAQNLNDLGLRKKIEQMVKLGCFKGLGGGPVCASFSMAVRPTVRSATCPFGLPGISKNMEAKVAEGNGMALWFFSLLELGLQSGLAVWMENPIASWMFRIPAWRVFAERWKDRTGFWTVDYCRFKKPWRKRTRFFSNASLRGVRTLCSRDHEHQQLKRRFKTSWTKAAEAYPDGVARALAAALAVKVGFLDSDGCFDPSACAMIGHVRIGEAKNPGPRPSRTLGRNGLLEAIPLVEARIGHSTYKVWEGFLEWLATLLSPGAIRSAMAQPQLLVLLAKQYGNHLYSSGKFLFVFRHFLVFLQQNHVLVKPYMDVCWSTVTRWEIAEPTVHRVPLPWVIFRAMLTTALLGVDEVRCSACHFFSWYCATW